MYKKNLSSVADIYASLVGKDNSFKMLDKFIRWSFTNKQQIEQFKIAFLNYQTY